MLAGTLLKTRIKQSKQMYREEASAWMEVGIDNIARGSVLRMLGIADEDEHDIVAALRAGFDPALGYYRQHGRHVLPYINPELNPYYGWLMALIYIVLTRSRMHPRALPPFMVKVTRDPHLIMRVSYKILTFVHDHKSWDKGEEWVQGLLKDLNMPYSPMGTWRDSDDILAVANLVGCRRWENLGLGTVRQMRKHYAEYPDPEISEFNLDPMVGQVMKEEERADFLMAFAFNTISVETQRPYYLSIPMPLDRQLDLLRMVLVVNRCLTVENIGNEDVSELIHELIRYMQVMRTEPIPQPRATELSKRMMDRFGFNLLTEQNDMEQMRIFQLCSISALCLSPEGESTLLN